ncbi:Rad21/Rec8-like protein N-terminal [Dioscorea alata]|uniref:Rad21/Rec8-like protein N-terminal n=1 Tax=Dioscorea alata TaxID=55571 RepID=A0ACB7V2I4_DIOAL|nr:Rad21/Rec8-like protein N-terminal [Dioscorea alata]
MFYSHQLLARKAPLGQIWMAATMHAKINRRKLDKLDIIKICEEILNPSVPMALRLSGILMGGVVIVYERKVKLLYDDVTRFLIEINEAWKVKAVPDPTVLPKGKMQAKYEAVTLPANIDMEMGQTTSFSGTFVSSPKFQRMQLDDLDEYYINIDPREDNLEPHHQAEAANITLFDDFGSGPAERDFYNRFERFDIGEDEENPNFNAQEAPQPQVQSTLSSMLGDHSQAPTNPLTSSLHPENPLGDIAVRSHQWEEAEEQQEDRNDFTQVTENVQRRAPLKRKKKQEIIMDNEQIMIPGSIYQSWLHNASNIISKRGRKIKPFNPILSTKIGTLMDFPPIALISGLEKFPGEFRYPAPLMALWRKCTEDKSGPGSNSGFPQQAPQKLASYSLPDESKRMASNSMEEPSLQHRPQSPLDELQGCIGSPFLDLSIDKLRANFETMSFQGAPSDQFVTPGSPGQSLRSFSSSGGSRHAYVPLEPEIQLTSVRSKRKQRSSSRTTLGSLDPVEEEFPLQQDSRDFKIRRLSEDGPTPDYGTHALNLVDLLEWMSLLRKLGLLKPHNQ